MILSVVAIGICLTLSAFFSGLTLGLMSLDVMGLQIVIESGNREEASKQERRDAELAQNIVPFRKRGNLLLCTLLFGNVAVNCILSIVMADLTSGPAGFLISTLAIVILGEVLPQAVCSRHPLAIGSACIPIVYIFVIVTFVISYPMSLMLDAMLGEDMGTVYSRNQLKGLLSMYSKMEKETGIGQEETTIMAGVVDFHGKKVGDCMTAIKDVFMIDIDDHLNFDLILRIFQRGHSRIPVYKMNPNHANSHDVKEVVGLLFSKELVLVDPEDCLPVRTICHHWFGRDVPVFYSDSKLTTVLNKFLSMASHMALVKEAVDITDGVGDAYYSTVGIVTLEDLLEEILQQEIYDEKDINHNSSRKLKKHHLAAGGGEMSAEHPLLRYLEARERKDSLLPPEEVLIYV
jgi:metal transporter CNNM